MNMDIPPILRILSSYLQEIPLSEDELELLRSWLMESVTNEKLFDEIANKMEWEKACPWRISNDLTGSMERIRMRITGNHDQASRS